MVSKLAREVVGKATSISLFLTIATNSASANPGLEADKKRSPIASNSATVLNPNPSVFSESPYNRLSLLLADSSQATKQAQMPASDDTETQAPSEPEIKPRSEAQENRIALVKAVNGQFKIRLVNYTNTAITYELVGHTNQRQLTANTSFMLQDLAMPVTVTVLREDGGLVKVTPRPAAPGILELRLDEALNLDQDRRAVRVREGGSLLVY
jgi:hypothetical protein